MFMILSIFSHLPTPFAQVEPYIIMESLPCLAVGAMQKALKHLYSCSADINTAILEEEFTLELVRPQCLLPVINSPEFVLPVKSEAFLDVCRPQ